MGKSGSVETAGNLREQQLHDGTGAHQCAGPVIAVQLGLACRSPTLTSKTSSIKTATWLAYLQNAVTPQIRLSRGRRPDAKGLIRHGHVLQTASWVVVTSVMQG